MLAPKLMNHMLCLVVYPPNTPLSTVKEVVVETEATAKTWSINMTNWGQTLEINFRYYYFGTLLVISGIVNDMPCNKAGNTTQHHS